MPEKYIVSQHYFHPEIGEIAIRVQHNSTRAIARWKGNILKISLPPRVTAEMFHRYLEDLKPKVLAAKPKARYADGSLLEFEDFSIAISHNSLVEKGYVSTRHKGKNEFAIDVAADLDFENPNIEKLIIKHILRIAKFMGQTRLPGIAEDVLRSIGISPMPEIAVSYGLSRLGYCSARRKIALSYAIMFLPAELRRLIICHEAAHLTEMNHSKDFHNLVDQYLNGREKDLEHRLKHFPWPVPR